MLNILEKQRRIKQKKDAIVLFHKNPGIYLGLMFLRNKKLKSLNDKIKELKKLKEKNKYIKDFYNKYGDKIKISKTSLANWKEDFWHLINNNKLYNEFLEDIGLKDINKKVLILKATQNKAEKEKEKKKKLKYEIEKAKIILSELQEDNLPASKQWEMIEGGRRQVEKIKNGINKGEIEIDKIDGIKELYDVNGKIIAKGKKKILESIEKINPKHLAEVKILSDIVDTAFKQNRLIKGESTDNVAVSISSIYSKIIEESSETIMDAEEVNND